MAPNKKKKKQQSNPARGFATTSTISKAQIQEPVLSSTDQQLDAATGDDSPHAQSIHDKQQAENVRELKDLTPEELEKQLEETDLQLLVDQHGDKVQRNASRQASRLQTERRLLRSNSDFLKIESWISSDIMDHIIKKGDSRSHSSNQEPISKAVAERNTLNSDDDLLVKAWTLYELLPQIGFSETQTWSALTELFQENFEISNDSSKLYKESIWGLDQCLDWKARVSDSSYTTSVGTINLKKPTAFSNDEKGLSGGDVRAGSGDLSLEKSGTQHEIQQETPPSLIDSSSTSSESDCDWDSDLEPDQMIEKYLSLRTRRFHLEPQVEKKVGKTFRGSTNPPGKPVRLSKRLDRIDTKLAKLKSDILFDEYDAEIRWNSAQAQLNEQAAERRRMGIAREHDASGTLRSALRQSQQCTPPESPNRHSDDLLGELFSSLPSTENLIAGEHDGLKSTDSAGQEIQIKDYGSWNGISPRRVLEEVCKSRYCALSSRDIPS